MKKMVTFKTRKGKLVQFRTRFNIQSKEEVEQDERKPGSWRARHPEYFEED